MRTHLGCMACFCRQTIDALRLVTDDRALSESVVRRVLRTMSEMDLSRAPAVMGGEIHRMIREESGQPDPYAALKERSNRFALSLYPDAARRVAESKDPLQTAARLAIAGNIIDMGIGTDFSEDHIRESIAHCLSAPIEGGGMELFREAVAAAEHILYLADNAGEIVFDKLLLNRLHPDRVTFVVKQSPVINDATRADAKAVGITDRVEVIDNGTDLPGTVLEECSPEFREHFDRADLIISKGQGNYETLNETPGNLFFLFKVKCPTVSKQAGCAMGSIVLMKGAHARASDPAPAS